MLCWQQHARPHAGWTCADRCPTQCPAGADRVCMICSLPCRFGKGKRGLIMGVWNAHTSVGECSSQGQAVPQVDATSRAGLVQVALALNSPTWKSSLQRAHSPPHTAPAAVLPTPPGRQHCGQPDRRLHAALRMGLVLHRAGRLHRRVGCASSVVQTAQLCGAVGQFLWMGAFWLPSL